MKKIILTLAAVVLLLCSAVFMVSCGDGEDITILNVYNWGEYISDGSEGSLDVNAAFEEYCKEKGLNVRVNYTTFDSNESMYNKLKSGAVSYDVIVPSEYMIERMIKEDMLAPLNMANIPNFEYIYDSFKTPFYDPDPDKVYSVPYFYGFVGIIYNTEHVDEADAESWSILWNETYKGKILQFNNPRDAFGTVQYKNGISVNDTEEAKWRACLEELKTQKPLVQSYVMDEIFNKMKNGSAHVAPYYAGDFLSMYEDNDSLAFSIPKEGTNIFVDAMCIPKGSKNKDIAEMYINFMLEKEIGKANSEFVYYATPNSLVNDDPKYIKKMNEVHENAIDYLAPDFIKDGYEGDYVRSYYNNLDEETLGLMNSLWEELKIKGDTEYGIYITSGIILAAALSLGIVKFVKNKRRLY